MDWISYGKGTSKEVEYCDLCRKEIAVGEEHDYIFGASGWERFNWTQCKNCSELIKRYGDKLRGSQGEFSRETFQEKVLELSLEKKLVKRENTAKLVGLLLEEED